LCTAALAGAHLETTTNGANMTTATATKPKDVLAGLAERDQKWSDARAKASELGREHGAKLKRAQELQDERRRAIHHDPELVDYRDQPTTKDNQIAKIDRELGKLGDLQDLWQRVEHARRLERSAEQSRRDFVASHFRELIDASRPEAKAVAERANAAAQALVVALNEYRELHGRIASYTVPIQGMTTHAVPGQDAAIEALRMAQSVDLPAPLPEVPHGH
jgi:hypothetical protein